MALSKADIETIAALIAATTGGASADDDEKPTPKTAKGRTTAKKAKVVAMPTHVANVDDEAWRFAIALESRNAKGEVTTKYSSPRVVVSRKTPSDDDFRKIATFPQSGFAALVSAIGELGDDGIGDLVSWEA